MSWSPSRLIRMLRRRCGISRLLSEDEVRQELIRLAAIESEGKPRFLFRGQTAVYPSVTAFIGRLSDQAEIGKAYTILRQLVGSLRGQIQRMPELLAPNPDETIALMQHYGWPTPFIDVTDSIDVAFFFASYHPSRVDSAELPESGVIYAVDTSRLPSEYRHVRHDDVIDPMLNLRWTKQRGHALAAVGWPDMQHVRVLDLLCLPGLKTYAFRPNRYASKKDETEYLPPLDPIAHQLAFFVSSLAEAKQLNPLPPVLARFPF